jgi:hypothetical protein
MEKSMMFYNFVLLSFIILLFATMFEWSMVDSLCSSSFFRRLEANLLTPLEVNIYFLHNW